MKCCAQASPEQLEREGYEVVVAADGASAGRALRDAIAFAIIGLADGDGVAADLRNQGLSCPILLLTDGEATGAQESLAKPFRFSALLARLHGLNTHQGAGEDRAVRIGPYTFHPSAKLLQVGRAQGPADGKGNQYPEIPACQRRHRAARNLAA